MNLLTAVTDTKEVIHTGLPSQVAEDLIPMLLDRRKIPVLFTTHCVSPTPQNF